MSSKGVWELIQGTDLIIADFDDTITESDTLHLLFDKALEIKGVGQYDASHYVNTYIEAKKNFDINHEELVQNRFKSITSQTEYQKLRKPVELSSVKETVRTKFFTGVTRRQFASCSNQIKLKAGFVKFLDKIHGLRIPLVILSVNWSMAMLEQLFSDLGVSPNDRFKIVANEFEFDSDEACTGKIAPNGLVDGIRTGYDKLVLTRKLLKEYNSIRPMYIGDSETDVLSMIECGRGISMVKKSGDSSAQYLTKLGVHLSIVQEDQWHFEADDWNFLLPQE